ncbi:TetR/AcrR family transcriptional regulator [Actinomyces bowdenii]|uniref:TetR/AcrR family transcriptional regulator n=1 Tax=Actinomyces bowdenii TaxID=131109 RepID=A0A3P1V8G5_9ACTO|nr:TetR/AcrR family transcriptional regulator [Actinomyces bowdenii]RRD29936.1 TetR/AcrR family transcriptional regulator [Actinomyces bowdenii]
MHDLPDPISRRDRQRQTREAIILAARASFARDGYHGARLDEIARAAGFSKGAVYSNFANKAELFLAIMDMNIEQSLATGGRVLFEVPSAELTDDSDAARSVRNFALATLEFVAVAARDEVLSTEVARRIDLQVLGYAAVAEAARAERGEAVDDDLDAEQVGALLSALYQGAAVLRIAGSSAFDGDLLKAGRARLLQPGGLSAGEMSEVLAQAQRLPLVEQRMAEAARDWRASRQEGRG